MYLIKNKYNEKFVFILRMLNKKSTFTMHLVYHLPKSLCKQTPFIPHLHVLYTDCRYLTKILSIRVKHYPINQYTVRKSTHKGT